MKRIIYFFVVLAIFASFQGCNKMEDETATGSNGQSSLKSTLITPVYCNDGISFGSFSNIANTLEGYAYAGYVVIKNSQTDLNFYLQQAGGFQNVADNVDIGFYNTLPTSRPDPNSLHYHFTTGSVLDFITDIPLGNLYIEDLAGYSSLDCGKPVYIVIHYDALDGLGVPYDIWTGSNVSEGTIIDGSFSWYKYVNYTPACCITCNSETAWGGNTAGSGNAWWKYFQISKGLTQNIYAGQKINVGTVTYNPVNGTLNINLTGGWVLDIKDENGDGYADDNTVKIQGYTTIPAVKPIPGLFKTYKGNSLTNIYLGSYPFYAIHLDVKLCK